MYIHCLNDASREYTVRAHMKRCTHHFHGCSRTIVHTDTRSHIFSHAPLKTRPQYSRTQPSHTQRHAERAHCANGQLGASWDTVAVVPPSSTAAPRKRPGAERRSDDHRRALSGCFTAAAAWQCFVPAYGRAVRALEARAARAGATRRPLERVWRAYRWRQCGASRSAGSTIALLRRTSRSGSFVWV